MTSRTHDLAAFTALNLIIVNYPLPEISLPTAIAAVGACFIGGLAPDIDEPTSEFWQKIPAGTWVGRIIKPLTGGHRLISHSLLGLLLLGYLARLILNWLSGTVLVDMDLVWTAFMVGAFTHLVMDTFTHEGVPWLFPIPIRLGIPPFKALRLKTGGIVEKGFVFPALLLLNIYIFYRFYPLYLQILQNLTK